MFAKVFIKPSYPFLRVYVSALLLLVGGHTGHLVNCEEMKLCKILGLNVKLKNYKSIFSPIMTVKREENLLKCDKCEVRSSR